jgi:perosamine synthetase
LPMFARQSPNKVSYGLFGRAMNLPSYHDMTDAQLATICGLVSATLNVKHGSSH